MKLGSTTTFDLRYKSKASTNFKKMLKVDTKDFHQKTKFKS